MGQETFYGSISSCSLRLKVKSDKKAMLTIQSSFEQVCWNYLERSFFLRLRGKFGQIGGRKDCFLEEVFHEFFDE